MDYFSGAAVYAVCDLCVAEETRWLCWQTNTLCAITGHCIRTTQCYWCYLCISSCTLLFVSRASHFITSNILTRSSRVVRDFTVSLFAVVLQISVCCVWVPNSFSRFFVFSLWNSFQFSVFFFALVIFSLLSYFSRSHLGRGFFSIFLVNYFRFLVCFFSV